MTDQPDLLPEPTEAECQRLRVISYGGGVQSTALVVLATQGKIGPVEAALFANVGDDSEHPDTLRYVREQMKPWAADRGLRIHELTKGTARGSAGTLHGQLTRAGSRSISIPIRMAETGAPGRRRCTSDFKIAVIGRWLRAHGATPEVPATVLVGFSTDEAHRVGNRQAAPNQSVEYPLLDIGMSRTDCKALIRSAGLPVPPKSACYFCPFKRPSEWETLRRERPELFRDAVALERQLNARRDELGKDHVYLTRFGRPLDEVITGAQESLDFGTGPGAEGCDEGYCWT